MGRPAKKKKGSLALESRRGTKKKNRATKNGPKEGGTVRPPNPEYSRGEKRNGNLRRMDKGGSSKTKNVRERIAKVGMHKTKETANNKKRTAEQKESPG